MDNSWPTELMHILRDSTRSRILRVYKVSDYESLLGELARDSSLEEILKEFDDACNTLYRAGDRKSVPAGPLACESTMSILETPSNWYLLSQSTDIDTWGYRQHCARAAVRLIQESSLPVFTGREMKSRNTWIAVTSLKIWHFYMWSQSQGSSNGISSTITSSQQHMPESMANSDMPKPQLEQKRKSRQDQSDEATQGTPKRHKAPTWVIDDSCANTVKASSQAVPTVSKDRKCEILQDELQNIRSFMSALETAEQEGKQKSETDLDAAKVKKANLEKRRAELLKLEAEVQSMDVDSEKAKIKYQHSEVEVARIRVDLKSAGEVETFKMEMLGMFA